MKLPPFKTLDFETLPIQQRPEYPPIPKSYSLRLPGEKKSKAWIWGHPSGNNCTLGQAKANLKKHWTNDSHFLFHNGKFDVDVAEVHFGLPRLPALHMHDSMFMMFLLDPHARNLDLKSLAESHLDWPPEERDEIVEWAKKNRTMLLGQHYMKPFKPAAYVGYAPGKLAKPYMKGDTDRTLALAKYAWKYIRKNGMMEAYEREQEIMPIFLDNERVGIRVNMRRLSADVKAYDACLEATDAWLRKRLKADISFDNDNDTAEALSKAGIIRDEDWVLTPTGNRSVAKGNMTPDMFQDKRVARALGYRNRLSTCLKMFMRPWLEQAKKNNGFITTNWNQIRGERGGTRTGRPSTNNHNFLNVSKTWGVDDGYEHPAHLKVLELPLVRKYMLPDKGEVWLHRDYNGQELRILGHAEDGPLMKAYQEDPWLDVHQHVATLIEDTTGKTFARKNVKIANFRIVYGGGAPATASGIGCSVAEAKELLDAHAHALPSIKGRGGLSDITKEIGRSGEALRTWGGRMYFAETPSYSKKYKRNMTYEYKLLNYYCQGSAADVTKQAIINYHHHPKRNGRFLVTVYDEINSSSGPAPKEEMAVLRESMECVSKDLDVPMLSEGKSGKTWGDQAPFKEGKSNYE